MNKLIQQYICHTSTSSPSSRRTSCDSCNSSDSDDKKNVKYKTQLCRTYQEKGSCPYGIKCRFAHGKGQLVTMELEPTKKKKCNSFWTKGSCPYGRRCRFGHDESTWESAPLLLACEAQCRPQLAPKSKLMRLLQ